MHFLNLGVERVNWEITCAQLNSMDYRQSLSFYSERRGTVASKCLIAAGVG